MKVKDLVSHVHKEVVCIRLQWFTSDEVYTPLNIAQNLLPGQIQDKEYY